jgi:hypothetical protein
MSEVPVDLDGGRQGSWADSQTGHTSWDQYLCKTGTWSQLRVACRYASRPEEPDPVPCQENALCSPLSEVQADIAGGVLIDS